MIDYREFKQKFFKDKIVARKKDLNYLTEKKNDSNDICSNCVYMESFSPYMQRCCLISFDISNSRSASVSINGKCDEFTKYNSTGRSIKLMEKYKSIEYDEMDKREVIMAHRAEMEKLK